MIPRYTPKDIGAIWTDAMRMEVWLDVELAVCAALAEIGRIPKGDVEKLERAAKGCDKEALAARAIEIEETTKHDVIAFLTAFEEIAGSESRHIHFGLTSSDVLDTAFALLIGKASEIIKKDLAALTEAVKAKAEAHRHTTMVGRTHGIHAEPITFGLVLASWYTELKRAARRFDAAVEDVRVGKLSGAVGTSAHLPLEVETKALTRLGLSVEPVATQVVPRDRHAAYFAALAGLGSSIERFSVEVRHLQRTEVYEAEEPFGSGQKGSSAMPHKRNPILTENLTGLARLMRAWSVAAFENVALWHERDISHSSVERVIAPDATITAVFMLRRMKRVVEGLSVHPERMKENLDRMRGLVFSQSVLLKLAEKGLTRQAGYVLVQRNAMRVWKEDISLLDALLEDEELLTHLSADEIRATCDMNQHLKNVDALIDRALAK